uniref:LysM domain-containing protein n=1 Tax=uncultured Thiotrichaceae bacterium TaxID=298394 RepID=A0A6S6UG81_9GAMM|nr:MAG: Unknown protein [uncultured Thiotrichaceae bacterium]
MNIIPRLHLLISTSALMAISAAPIAAAETTVEVRENDTLGSIVSKTYPGYRSRNALMQLILEQNPDAFIGSNINLLVLGETLKLPDSDELEALIGIAPPPVQQVIGSVTAEAKQRLKQITEERDRLKQQLANLEADNQRLKATISRLETAGTQQNEQLERLEKQIESLQSRVTEQTPTPVANSPEIIKQLADSNEKLAQLQASYDASVKDKAGLEQELVAKSALENQISELQKQIAELQGGGTTQQTANSDLQKQLDTLKQESEGFRVDNEKVASELAAVSAKLETSQSDVDTLRAELDTANEQLKISQSEVTTLRAELGESGLQLEASQSEATTLRSELSASSESNATLQSEIEQIQAAVENDVALSPAKSPEKPGSTWWPWLLALLLLPVAWLLGQRSRPAPTATESDIQATEMPVAMAMDPVVPEPLTSEQLDQIALSGPEAIATPDDPNAAIKLDMARAYMDLRNTEAANDMLQEVIQEGGSQQQQEAKEILSFIA